MTSVSVWPAREVPLGGLRSMNVLRTLPQRGLPTVGAWCFLDRFGPQRTTMTVLPHPHTGLQTVTWPLKGTILHKDSLGSEVVLEPGQLNLMTSGAGIAHSEFSVVEDAELDALQFWIALPESARNGAAAFEQHKTLPRLSLPATDGSVATATVVMGEFMGARSPATTYSPLAGVHVNFEGKGTLVVNLNHGWEYAAVALSGDVTVSSTPAPVNDLTVIDSHDDRLEISTAGPAELFLLGGAPFEEELVMWWNFVGKSHSDIAEARQAWESGSPRFGLVPGHGAERIPAPPMPEVTLAPRKRA